ncbi:MAG: hypothetical protein AB9834_17615 [Lentimicrobium sp.]
MVWLLSITSLITFAVGFLQALMGPMILAFSDAKTFGTVQTIAASGMLMSSFFIGIFSKTGNHLRVLSVALGFTGIFYALFGTSTSIIFITTVGFLFFTTLPFINTSLEVLIRKNVENQMQGRVWSIVSLISQLGMVIAFAIAGTLADKIFNPLLLDSGPLASTVGKLTGTGEGRGIGLMFLLAGLFTLMVAILLAKSKAIVELEN